MKHRSEIGRLKLQNRRLRAQVARWKAKYRGLKAGTVPVEDYEELSDLAGELTGKHVRAARRQRIGPENQAKHAAGPRAIAQEIYDEKRAAGHSKARARKLTRDRLASLQKKYPKIRAYSPEYLRKILVDKM